MSCLSIITYWFIYTCVLRKQELKRTVCVADYGLLPSSGLLSVIWGKWGTASPTGRRTNCGFSSRVTRGSDIIFTFESCCSSSYSLKPVVVNLAGAAAKWGQPCSQCQVPRVWKNSRTRYTSTKVLVMKEGGIHLMPSGAQCLWCCCHRLLLLICRDSYFELERM